MTREQLAQAAKALTWKQAQMFHMAQWNQPQCFGPGCCLCDRISTIKSLKSDIEIYNEIINEQNERIEELNNLEKRMVRLEEIVRVFNDRVQGKYDEYDVCRI